MRQPRHHRDEPMHHRRTTTSLELATPLVRADRSLKAWRCAPQQIFAKIAHLWVRIAHPDKGLIGIQEQATGGDPLARERSIAQINRCGEDQRIEVTKTDLIKYYTTITTFYLC